MTLTIDGSTCTKCGECARECPSGAIRQKTDGGYTIEGRRCIRCSHCAAVCPVDAVGSDAGRFAAWEAPRLPPDSVAALIRGKRSVRRYHPRAVDPGLVEEILLTGSLAASASNAQDSVATVLTGEALGHCHEGVRALFGRAAGLLKNPLVRLLLLATEARRYVVDPYVLESLNLLVRSRMGGADRIFFSAPMVVVLSAPRRNARFGKTDCVLAGAHMMLHAESLGLASCMVGFAELALNLRPRLRRGLGVPTGHRVNLVFTLGHPAVGYRRLPLRKPLVPSVK